jgi:ribosome biogenesis GTPase
MSSPSRRVAGRLRALSGRIVAADDAGAQVLTRAGRVRATWGGGLLAAAACSAEAFGRRGDAVRLLAWPDGRLTVEHVIMRPVPAVVATKPDAS